ncbi:MULTISPECIES: MBL fold metallo-hydrolase [Methylococcus]|uniref:MBL fold metallo-hydrolase n=1 Tax=Methylococcus capsulatus TaxID=414 RepID=A0ABZ2F4M7_METCP|nr:MULTISPECIES: MBL fold metallo-hydrolase [Methylococcus]MDF9392332.1 MBL fold metallo-hydrolase [Methylococcus capsulatus]
MKLTFIGVGSAFALQNYQSNVLIESQGRKLLIDCGSDARFALHRLGLGAEDIDALYVSHLHADHIGGIEWLGFSRYFSGGMRPELFIEKRLAEHLWERSLRGGMASVQGRSMRLDDFFSTVHRLSPGGAFRFGSLGLRLFSTLHYFDCRELAPSYGLVIDVHPEAAAPEMTEPRCRIVLTTDTQFCPDRLAGLYDSADVIFQDCETAPRRSGIHAHYDELCGLPASIRKKMWLYHYQDGPLPDAAGAGFHGFVRQGQVFEF